MNNSARITWRVPRKSRRTSLLRIGAAVLLAISLTSVVLAVWAKPMPPGVIDGATTHMCPDAYETDDEPASAGTLGVGAPQLRNFDGNTILGVADKDWARFLVVRTGVYTLTTSNLSAQTDTVLALHDADGILVVENDNAGGPSSQIVWTAPETASGWYYVSAYPTGTTPYANCVGTVVSYTLSFDSKVPQFIFAPLIVRNIP